MTKKELLARIEALERRVRQLEARPIVHPPPVIIEPYPTPVEPRKLRPIPPAWYMEKFKIWCEAPTANWTGAAPQMPNCVTRKL